MEKRVRQRKPPKVIESEETFNVGQSVAQTAGWGKAACLSLLAALILLPAIIWLIPAPIDPVAYSLPVPPALEGVLAPNTILQKAERVLENQITGPESVLYDKGYLYTGTADGKVMVVHKGELRILAQLGKEPCGAFEDEPTCGRPLGMRLDKDGYLIVADAYLGLHKINVATGDVHVLWSSSEPINGKLSRFMNDLDIAKDGTIYLTDSSTRWDRRHNRYLIMEGEDTGRLLAFHPGNNTMVELVSGIPFANGVQLSRDQSFLVVASTTMASLFRYNLQGPNAGELEIFAENLPGLPDNVRRSHSGGFWVGLAGLRKRSFSLLDYTAPRPWLRKLFTKIFSQEMIIRLVPKYGLVIELNEQGEIIRSLHDPTGSYVPAVSEVEDQDGTLYFGSYSLPYLSRLNLRSIRS